MEVLGKKLVLRHLPPLVTYLSHCCSYQPELVTLSIVSGAASVSSAKKVIVSLNQIVSYFVILVMFALANKYISHFPSDTTHS